jgi:hypothetical protein
MGKSPDDFEPFDEERDPLAGYFANVQPSLPDLTETRVFDDGVNIIPYEVPLQPNGGYVPPQGPPQHVPTEPTQTYAEWYDSFFAGPDQVIGPMMEAPAATQMQAPAKPARPTLRLVRTTPEPEQK